MIEDAFLVTPNIPEAEILTGLGIVSIQDMKEACVNIKSKNVLIKGGHLAGDDLVDVLYADGKFYEFSHTNFLSNLRPKI